MLRKRVTRTRATRALSLGVVLALIATVCVQTSAAPTVAAATTNTLLSIPVVRSQQPSLTMACGLGEIDLNHASLATCSGPCWATRADIGHVRGSFLDKVAREDDGHTRISSLLEELAWSLAGINSARRQRAVE